MIVAYIYKGENVFTSYMKNIQLICPTCFAAKIQKLPEQIMSRRYQHNNGIIGILVPENTVCNHLFIVYVDKHFAARDRVAADQLTKFNKRKLVTLKDIDGIIANLQPKTIKNILEKL